MLNRSNIVIYIIVIALHKCTSLKCYSSIGSSDGSLKYNDVQTCNEGHTCVVSIFLTFKLLKSF